jgi:Uncharacterised protein family (UPF0236)
LKNKQTQKRVRPFEETADVVCRSYSLPLQRAMTDFGADESFAKASTKLKEHYGIDISARATQHITEFHAQVIHLNEELSHQRAMEKKTQKRTADVIISELDGSMVPIVEFTVPADKTTDEVDLRKHRTLSYKEARLMLAHEKGSVTPVYGATMGDVHEAGKRLRACSEAVGLNDKTDIHGVGDGAPWIAIQFEEQFGSQSTYLIDFYHLCDYLAAAASKIPNSQAWLDRQKTLLKNSQADQVLMALKPYLEAANVPDESAPVRACYRYIDNRNGQFLYKEAIESDLPIGSGEVESEHRYISQKRLKIPGAWWKIENAENMLSLRVLRANNLWSDYWEMTRLGNAA